MSTKDAAAVVGHMVERGILFDEAGLLSVGPEGEQSFGFRNFMELCSVFTTPPLVRVLHGRLELGVLTSFQVPSAANPSSGVEAGR
jgi:ATP-dependent Lhr-like helicase